MVKVSRSPPRLVGSHHKVGSRLSRRCRDHMPQSAPKIYHGSCLCTKVRYELLTPPKAVTHCHCGQCQKSHGAAFSTYGAVPHGALRIVTGAADIQSYASSEFAVRQFCAHCGSSLFWSQSKGDWPDWVCIALGTLDTPFTPEKQKHTHVASKAPWDEFVPAEPPKE